ncbi:MAG: asparagine synthase (glutamine-hydrolyzing) [Rhodocyclales bacterium]|nr:asparagine synthase (glutamine-hydrolyzing) [Rhodocyclales bacterium]
MCGFAGYLTSMRLEHPSELLRRMGEAIAHRGPDDSGVWVDEHAGIGLVHRRLSIVDLSPAGHQPMESLSGRYLLVFNGEIYNFREIRQEIEAKEILPWRGHTDTEVMLAAFETWGIDAALNRFVGMFAFALWDRQDRCLYLCRDRMGEKPLYYGWSGGVFLFGSELKAMRSHPAWRGEVDRRALALLLRYNYVPAPYSIHVGIRKVVPGTLLRLDAEAIRTGIEPAAKTFWSLAKAVERGLATPFAGSDVDVADELDRLLRQAVAGQMVADVPLGAFLSGGVDSSTIVALMQAQSPRPVKTFSIGFHEKGYDEAIFAKRIARYLGTDHTELYVTSAQAQAIIPRLPTMYDEPFSDASQIPTFLVAQLARQRVTVSLSGDAGDELFGGYNRYFLARGVWNALRLLPFPLRRALAAFLTRFSPAAWSNFLARLGPSVPPQLRGGIGGDKVHKLASVLPAQTPSEMYRSFTSHWDAPEDIVIGGIEPLTALTGLSPIPGVMTFTEVMMYLDTLSYLPDDILAKVDRASMAVSLESRIPFLDHRVVEFAWRLPLSVKIRHGEGKWILRQVLYKYVPKKLVERPKMGFGVPIDVWLRGPLRDWAEDLLSESRLRQEGYFNPAPIRRKWAEHLSGRRNWQYHLWDVLMFQAWLEIQ